MMTPDALDQPGTVTVQALTYHTVDHAAKHAEGETYTVDDPALLSTLVGCGFVQITSVAAHGAPAAPPLDVHAPPHGRTHR